ncbi:MAG: sugar ABC transporter ATP-binding protein, partial [Burkholderiales bacterium]|nr:sugar ABC transporter ATP-binding protein [Anaerolineae bacterium]
SDVRLSAQSAPISLRVHEGEIVGLAGLEGQGQEHFLEMLCGLRKPYSGQVIAHPSGQPIKSLRDGVKQGITYLPRNRKTQGILPALSVHDNFAIGTLEQTSRFGIINRKTQRERLAQFRDRLSMLFASPDAPITSLSGGNQQKVLLARWMAANPRLMILNDPTRGVDLPTRLKLYEVFKEMAAAEKTALVVLSTEIEEILQLCDRVLVFRNQHVFKELDRSQMTMRHIVECMFGNTDGI